MAIDELGRVVPMHKVRYLNPADQVVKEMFAGWRRQQLSRNLALPTIDGRERLVRRFMDHSGEMPWRWTVQHVDEFFGDLRAENHLRQSTVRAYQNAVRVFCRYLIDPGYGWDALCEGLFGTHPTQVCFEWNTARHSQANEGGPEKRAFTRKELQDFFDLPTKRSPAHAGSAARAIWRLCGTRCCSRPPMRGACDATRSGTCRPSILSGTRTLRSSAASVCCTCGGARRIPVRHRNGGACLLCSTGAPRCWRSGSTMGCPGWIRPVGWTCSRLSVAVWSRNRR